MLEGITESTECAQSHQNIRVNRPLDIVDPMPGAERINGLDFQLYRQGRPRRIAKCPEKGGLPLITGLARKSNRWGSHPPFVIWTVRAGFHQDKERCPQFDGGPAVCFWACPLSYIGKETFTLASLQTTVRHIPGLGHCAWMNCPKAPLECSLYRQERKLQEMTAHILIHPFRPKLPSESVLVVSLKAPQRLSELGYRF